jgi:hypothetical protein
MSVKSVLTLMFLNVLVLNCASGIKEFNNMRYTDQNNNVFNITAQKITYRAVQPEYSSTGYYSGGLDFEVPIQKDDYNSIKQLVTEILNDTTSHAVKREKTIAVLEVVTKNNSNKVLLKPSIRRDALDNLLHSLKP